MIKNRATPFCGSWSISRNKPLNIHLPYNKGMAMIQIEPFCVPQVGGGARWAGKGQRTLPREQGKLPGEGECLCLVWAGGQKFMMPERRDTKKLWWNLKSWGTLGEEMPDPALPLKTQRISPERNCHNIIINRYWPKLLRVTEWLPRSLLAIGKWMQRRIRH